MCLEAMQKAGPEKAAEARKIEPGPRDEKIAHRCIWTFLGVRAPQSI